MYTPGSFRVDDVAELSRFVRAYGFGALISGTGDQLQATHLPMLLRGDAAAGGRLLCHMARANPQWRQLQSHSEVLCIFTGPHTYISPSLYASGDNVPTWNYTAVHIYARPRVIEDAEELELLLNDLVEQYEATRPNRWVDTSSSDYRQQLIQAIVGIELTIGRVEGKFKLSQNRPADIARVIEGLSVSEHPDDQAVAKFMSMYYEKRR